MPEMYVSVHTGKPTRSTHARTSRTICTMNENVVGVRVPAREREREGEREKGMGWGNK